MTAPTTAPTGAARYEFHRTGSGAQCDCCGAEFPRADGSIMRSHASRCPVKPRTYTVPGVCWA